MMKLNNNRALVLFSGGQDSAICLAWALERFDVVETIGFSYGQRHDVELDARQAVRNAYIENFPEWSVRLDVDTVIDLHALGKIGQNALTSNQEIMIGTDGLPTTFVPGRNLIFLTMAAAYSYNNDLGTIVGGMCEADFSGYPDCRVEALSAQLHAINIGMDTNLKLEVPLMHITKSQSWHLTERLGGQNLIDIVNEFTHTCYRGIRRKKHQWGYGCGECPSCNLRMLGWNEFISQKKENGDVRCIQ